jgi:hypothetical protein
MAELGNNIVNKILEGRIPSPSATAAGGGEPALRKPGPESSRPEREAWIFAKYRDRRFVDRDIFQAEEFRPVLRIRIHRIHMFLGLPDPGPSIIMQK